MRKIASILLIILILTFSISCELFNPTQPDVNIYGLFVGLDYINSDVNNLNGTINDTREMAAAFYTLANAYGIDFEGYLALQEGSDTPYDDLLYPSKENILALIEEIGTHMKSNDLFIFYYAGHGLGSRYLPTHPSNGFLVTAKENDSEDYSQFSTTELSDALSAINGTKIIILDSCFSGAHVSPYPKEETIISPRYEANQFYLTASMENQESWESDGHGYFTLNFLEYLGWQQSATEQTHIEMYSGNSIIVKEEIDVYGKFPSGVLSSLPHYISLTDIASSLPTLRVSTRPVPIYQEKKITSGPTNVLLFNKDW
ncbi:MAG: caspase family protein [Spirochaetia bacterium]|nr:caspase family protein [Spirochaetia bacterium]